MSNYGIYQIPQFEDDISNIKEFLRIAFNTIFFHRWLGETNFEDCDSSFSNLTYVKIKNENLQKTIENKISLLEKNIVKTKRAQVTLNFYEKKILKYYLYEENSNIWESWKFLFCVKNNDNNDNKENKIRQYLSFILQKLNDKIDFMPNFPIDSKLPEETFPYEIIVNTEMKESDFIAMIKEMNIKNALKDDFI
jgi:hypothetical protein